jgi:hypothetical protein
MYGPGPVRKESALILETSCIHVSGLSMEHQLLAPGHDGNPRVFSISLQRPLRP